MATKVLFLSFNERHLNQKLAFKPNGGASSEILVRHKGGIFFWDGFYCIFGQFEVMTPISKSEKLGRLEPHGPHC